MSLFIFVIVENKCERTLRSSDKRRPNWTKCELRLKQQFSQNLCSTEIKNGEQGRENEQVGSIDCIADATFLEQTMRVLQKLQIVRWFNLVLFMINTIEIFIENKTIRCG